MGREVLGTKHSNKKSSTIVTEVLIATMFGIGAFFGFVMPPENLAWLKYLLVVLIPLCGIGIIIYTAISANKARKAPNDVISIDRATNTLYIQTKKGEQQVNIRDLAKSRQLQQTATTSVNAPFYHKSSVRMYGYIYLKTNDKKTIKSIKVENPANINEQIRAIIASTNPTPAKKSKINQKEADKQFNESIYK